MRKPKKLTDRAVVAEICKREGKIREVSVGNVREVLANISDLSVGWGMPLWDYFVGKGMKRLFKECKRKKAKKR